MLLRHVAASVVTPPSCLILINLSLICCMDYTRLDVRRGDNESGGECVCGQAQAVGRTERGHANDSEYHISKQLSLLLCSSIVITEYLWSKDVSVTWMNMWLEEKQTTLIVLMNSVASWVRVRECLSYFCRFIEQLRVSDLHCNLVCLSILICINVKFKCHCWCMSDVCTER